MVVNKTTFLDPNNELNRDFQTDSLLSVYILGNNKNISFLFEYANM